MEKDYESPEKEERYNSTKSKSSSDQNYLFADCSELRNAQEIEKDLQDTFYSVQNTKLYNDLRERTQVIIGSHKKIDDNEKCEMLAKAMKKYLELEGGDIKKGGYIKLVVTNIVLLAIAYIFYILQIKEPF